MEEQQAGAQPSESEFQAWWEGFLADWQRRYPTLTPPAEAEARASFKTVWRVWQARERAAQQISNSWQRVEHPRLAAD